MVQTKCKLNKAELFVRLFYIQSKEVGNKSTTKETKITWKTEREFAWISMALEGRRLMAVYNKNKTCVRKRPTETATRVQQPSANVTVRYNILPSQSACICFLFFVTSFSFQTYLSTALILEGADTGTKKEELDTAFYTFEWTARIHGIGFRKWRNKVIKLKLKKSICLLTVCSWSYCSCGSKGIASFSRILWQPAKIGPEWLSQSNRIIGRPMEFVIGRLNTSTSLYRIAPC